MRILRISQLSEPKLFQQPALSSRCEPIAAHHQNRGICYVSRQTDDAQFHSKKEHATGRCRFTMSMTRCNIKNSDEICLALISLTSRTAIHNRCSIFIVCSLPNYDIFLQSATVLSNAATLSRVSLGFWSCFGVITRKNIRHPLLDEDQHFHSSPF